MMFGVNCLFLKQLLTLEDIFNKPKIVRSAPLGLGKREAKQRISSEVNTCDFLTGI